MNLIILQKFFEECYIETKNVPVQIILPEAMYDSMVNKLESDIRFASDRPTLYLDNSLEYQFMDKKVIISKQREIKFSPLSPEEMEELE